jgi:hypothetical protein
MEAVLEKATAAVNQNTQVFLAVLLVLVLLVVWLGWSYYKNQPAATTPPPAPPAGGVTSYLSNPSATNYNQASDQVAVGDTANMNVNLTGPQILSSPDFGCATRTPWSGDDAWAWEVQQARSGGADTAANLAGSNVASFNRPSAYARAYPGQASRPSAGARIQSGARVRSGTSGGYNASDLSAVLQGGTLGK